MIFTALQIAQLVEGSVDGNEAQAVSALCKIEEGKTGALSFLGNMAYESYIYNTKASIVIVNTDFVPSQPLLATCTLIRVPEARTAFAKLLEVYNQYIQNKTGIEQPSFIAATSTVGENIYVGAFAYIGENTKLGNNVKIYPQAYIGDHVTIGDNTVVYAGVKIYAGCEIGASCTLHSGSIVGGDGFGFAPNSENNYAKVPQIGNVILEDYVEIGANTTIDRATLGSTIIRKGVKLDNLIQIAHNVEIGENTVIAAQTGVAGSTKIGRDCMIGGQVGIIGHLIIANGVKIAAQSGVGSSVKDEGSIVQGSPAFAIGDYKRAYVHFRNLPELANKIKGLEDEIKQKA
ncbi:MAG: UDP-3-O-(3-hydroxymyristoyl)glucosamine N-acyltransferase [Bacteroidia bacterium]|nr:UDP-3-O-(3-hydroxymyristoyl)glucosamine N-acyltransferase [Bacteroidia bacterium]